MDDEEEEIGGALVVDEVDVEVVGVPEPRVRYAASAITTMMTMATIAIAGLLTPFRSNFI